MAMTRFEVCEHSIRQASPRHRPALLKGSRLAIRSRNAVTIVSR
jgi:hypothetical protein